MAHVAPKPQSSEVRNLEPGTYHARCYQMVQLGTHTEEYLGKPKTAFKIWLGWEFPTELDTFSPEKGPQPYTMGREFPFSMFEKAGFRLTLESWRGKRFTDAEADTFDAGKLLGAVCQISVQEYTKKNGETGVKIGAVIPVAKGTIVDPQINPTQDFSLLDGPLNHSLLNDLPKFLREKIEASPEYKDLTGTAEPVFNPSQEPAMAGDEDASDLPF